MDQARDPGTEERTPPQLRELIFGQAQEISVMQQELNKAFPTVQSQIAVLEKTSQTTVGSVAKLANQVNAIAGVLAGIQQSLDALTVRVSPEANPAPVLGPGSASNRHAGLDPPTPPQPQSEPGLASPRPFNGDFNLCRGFLSQCELLFTHQPSKYSSDGSKIAFIMSLLVDDALRWAIAAVENNSDFATEYSQFRSEFRAVFDHPAVGLDAPSRLLVIRQGPRSVAQYTLEFRILAAESQWNDPALLSAYRRGLSDSVKDLIVRDSPRTLNELISLSLKMDARLLERRADRSHRSSLHPVLGHSASVLPITSTRAPPRPPLLMLPPAPSTSGPGEPMEVGRSRLSPAERQKRWSHELCLYCGESGHYIRTCPTRPKRSSSPVGSMLVSSATVPQPKVSPNRLFPATLVWGKETLSVSALIDSGADENLMDVSLARQAGIPLVPLEHSLSPQAIDGHSLGTISYSTEPLMLTLSGNHTESIRFYVLHAPTAPLVLGRPWLERHEPHISWASGQILGWSTACHAVCLRSALSPSCGSRPKPSPPEISDVPPVYHDLALVFDKDQALSLPPHRPYDCAIDLLPGAPFPKGRLYNLSLPEKEAMRNYISESLLSGIIRPSSSPLAAGFFFVAKKDGGLRPCVDYRGLNSITVKNKYPLPLISSTFEPLTHARVFSKLDLRSAYHLVRIKEGDEWKTAFNTHLGHFEYRVMPFGLSNAPAVFQALVNDVLRDMLNIFVVVYLDDILIFSRTLEEHQQHVRLVLQRLLENRLFVRAEKCVFHADSVTYLGNIVEAGQMTVDPAKVRAVEEWPRPTNRTQLRRFLGFAGFLRRFIKGFSQIAAPLNALTSISRPFSWTPEAETALSKLKGLFSTAPVLVHPDPGRQFIVEVDASDTGIGAILSQRSEEDQKVHPCAYFSRSYNPAERNYDVGNKELLAVHDALREWRHWLEGAKMPFTVWSDHKNLTYLRTAKRLNSRQARWALFLGRFDFTLTYRPGSKNVKADALSRQFSSVSSAVQESSDTVLPPTRVVGAVTWPIDSVIKEALQAQPDPGNGPPNRQFVPDAARPQVLEWGHSSPVACHPGERRTAEFIGRRFWWPTLKKDVREFVAACTICARSKASHRPPAGLLQPLPIPNRPWSHIGMDFVTGLPVSQGNDTILTVVDRFSKAVHLVPLPKLPSAAETADLLTFHVVRLHGIPTDIVSDRGPQFSSKVWKAFCKGIGATVSLTSGYHPQTNGQTERANQAVETVLRCVVSKNPSSWAKYLAWVEYSLNTMESSATGMSPFQCSLGYQPPLFPQQELEVAVPSTKAHLRRCRRVWRVARAALLRASVRAQRGANRRRARAPVYQPGQRVWLLARDLPLQTSQTSTRKLNPRFVGPYTVDRIISPVAVRLDLPPALKVHPVFHVSQLKPVATSSLSPPEPAPPLPRILPDGDPVWSVRKLLAVRPRGRGFQYLVDWEGFGPEDRSWVPASFLADPSLLDDFYRDNPGAPGRSSGASPQGGGTVVPQVPHMPSPSPARHTRAKARRLPPQLAACTGGADPNQPSCSRSASSEAALKVAERRRSTLGR